MSIYDSLGVKKYINAHDTYTVYGGSRMEPDVLKAMNEAAAHFVDINELQDILGKKIAKLTNNEAAYLTSGASAGLMLAATVVLAGDDADIFKGLPAQSGLKNEIIVMTCQRNPFLSAVTAAGARIVEVGTTDGTTIEELRNAVNEKTAGITYFAASNHTEKALPLKTVIEIAKNAKIPVIIDAAAQLPPAENLWYYTGLGAELVIFSGGKTLAGPQCSGLIVGNARMIELCKKYGAPAHGVCRSSKIGKEEMVGLYAAVKRYMAMDHEANRERLTGLCRQIVQEMHATGVMHAEVKPDGPVGQDFPLAYAQITSGFSPNQLHQAMKAEGIYIGVKGDAVFINPLNLREQEVERVIVSLKDCVKKLNHN